MIRLIQSLFSIFIFIFIFIFILNSNAQDTTPASTQATASAVPCTECSPKTDLGSIKDQASDLLNHLNKSFECDTQTNPNDCLLIDWLKWKAQKYAPNCKGFFIDANGGLGSYSKLTSNLILDEMQTNGDNSLFINSNPDFDHYCPNFKNFTVAQKAAFHSWIFELTAFPETSCTVNLKPSNGVTTKAVCMYQLEDLPKFRYWRSAGFKPARCAV